jgi:hypothetical protein
MYSASVAPRHSPVVGSWTSQGWCSVPVGEIPLAADAASPVAQREHAASDARQRVAAVRAMPVA